jgi:hypothetical protein
MRLVSILVSFSLVGLAACSGSNGDLSGSEESDLTHDQADRSCVVTLRTASVDFSEPVRDKNGAGWFSITAEVNVLETAGAPGMLWLDTLGTSHVTSAHDDAPVKIAGAPKGFQRFRFVLTHDTISADSDVTLVESSHVALLPFVVSADRSRRLFDHNRVTGDFDMYTLWSGDTAGGLVPPPPNDPEIGARFTVKDAPGVCVRPPHDDG